MAQWLEKQRQKNRGAQAFSAYLARVTPIVHGSIDRYGECLRRLDALCDSILSNPQTVKRLNLRLPDSVALLDYFERIGAELRSWVVELQDGPADRAIEAWQRLLDDSNEYRDFMTRLIHNFGNYETIALSLPGTGPIITDRRVQSTLGEMFAIKCRLIRLLELAYTLRRAWTADPPCPTQGFFNSDVDLSRLVRGMLAEYMIQADPQRIEAARQKARQAGRRRASYRFWRPAEALRQMADVVYQRGPDRIPKPRNHYVELRIGQAPTICADMTRLSWAVKELFNNAIAATSIVTIDRDGKSLVAQPLKKHAIANPPPAICLTVMPTRVRRGSRKRRGTRLIISDDGVGIDEEALRYVTLWAFSTHRDWIDDPDSMIAAPSLESKQMLIGGKGIGLAFARATIQELGGELSIASKPGCGTEVTIDLPSPTLC